MAMLPRSQVALMREPREFVAGRYFVTMDCMVMMFLIGHDYPPGSQALTGDPRG